NTGGLEAAARVIFRQPRRRRRLGIHAEISLEIVLGRESRTWSSRNANGRRDIIECIGRNIGYNTLMRTDTMTHFTTHTQPVGWINVDKGTRFTAKLRILQTVNVVITLKKKLSGETYTKAVIV